MTQRHVRMFALVFLFTSAAIVVPTTTAQWQVQQSVVTPAGTLPSPRNSLPSAYDSANDRIILHSGNNYGSFPDDVWVLKGAVNGPRSWQQLVIPDTHPVTRELHVGAYDPVSNRFIIHAGWPGYADTWVLSNANGLGGTPQWTQLPSAPQRRIGPAWGYDASTKRLVVSGGVDGNYYTVNAGLNDVWVLTNADGTGTPAWQQLFPSGTPPIPRAQAGFAYDPVSNRLVMHGGTLYSPTGAYLGLTDELWVLTHANGLGGTPTWIKLAAPGGPTPVAAHGMAYDPARKRAVLVGGSRPSGALSNEVWVLDNADGTTGTPHWTQATASGPDFLGNAGFAYGYSPATQQFVMALGALGSGYRNDAWLLDLNQVVSDENSLDVVMLGMGTGTVGSVPSGIACPGDCSDAYSSGTIVTLTATADAGSQFVRWGAACAGNGICSLLMDGSKTVSATFAPPGVDLIEQSVGNPPPFIQPGGMFHVTDTTYNRGAADVPTITTTRYYLSLDPTRSSNDIRLTGSKPVAPLSGATGLPGGADVVVPKSAALGTYFVLACADDLKQVAETNETNNCESSGTAVTVALPDLIETAASNPPIAAAPGSSFMVSDTALNQGDVVAGPSTTRYYLSPDGTKDPGDVLMIGTRSIPGLAPGATSSGTRKVTIPLTTPVGTAYRLLACADDLLKARESNEANNCIASSSSVHVGWPDLVVSAVNNPPAWVLPGGKFTVNATVRNQGSAPAGASTTRYYLSHDGTKDLTDLLLGGTNAVGALTPGASSPTSKLVTVPLPTPLGVYYVLACADDLFNVPESDEANNCGASGRPVVVGGLDVMFIEGGVLKRMDLDGNVLKTYAVGSDVGSFALSDDQLHLAFIRGDGNGDNSLWHWNLALGAPEFLANQSWAGAVAWLPGSTSAFLYGRADGTLQKFEVATKTTSLWQAIDTAAPFNKDVYRGGVAWNAAFTKFVAEIGVGGAGGDGLFGGDYCDDGQHHICGLHVVWNPAGASSSWATVAGGPALSSDGRFLYFTDRFDWNENRVVRMDLTDFTQAVIRQQTLANDGFGSPALFKDRLLVFPGLPVAGDRAIYVCDTSAPGVCATFSSPGTFTGGKAIPVAR